MTGPVGELIDDLRLAPDRSGLFVDFDGTVAPIVDDPASARPRPDTLAALVRLAELLGVVGVLSGRPLTFLSPWFPASVRLAGLYGLEQRIGGEVSEHPTASRWRPVIGELAERARGELPRELLVEPKGVSLTIHYRTSPDHEAEAWDWAERRGPAAGLEVRSAKMSVELHPPVRVDKGTALAAWSGGLTTVVYCGDDVGDLPAFDALEGLGGPGPGSPSRWAIAVDSAELPDRLRRQAAIVVDGPEGLASLLEQVAAAVTP